MPVPRKLLAVAGLTAVTLASACTAEAGSPTTGTGELEIAATTTPAVATTTVPDPCELAKAEAGTAAAIAQVLMDRLETAAKEAQDAAVSDASERFDQTMHEIEVGPELVDGRTKRGRSLDAERTLAEDLAQVDADAGSRIAQIAQSDTGRAAADARVAAELADAARTVACAESTN